MTRYECLHCGAEVDQDGHVWVHLDAADSEHPERCDKPPVDGAYFVAVPG